MTESDHMNYKNSDLVSITLRKIQRRIAHIFHSTKGQVAATVSHVQVNEEFYEINWIGKSNNIPCSVTSTMQIRMKFMQIRTK